MKFAPPVVSFPTPFGRYVLIDRVADGGMAEIFLAVEECQHAGRRFVTIKRIRTDQCFDPDFVDFFLTEGRVSLKCTHPNLPQAYELGEVDGVYYLAMEYIPGHTLLDFLRGAIRARELPSVGAVVTIGLGVAAALEHAHGLRGVDGEPLGVIHRDVTPQNIMISGAGSVKLIDFGIVRSAIQVHHTATGIVKGKFAYMAPEQLEGRPIDHRADLFALGIVMWESLVARPLFRGRSDLETVDHIRSMVVLDPAQLRPDVPPSLAAVVLKALDRDPDKRFQSATTLLSALEQVAEHCRMVPSVTRLRREVSKVCGERSFPVVPPALVADQEASLRLAAGSEPGAESPDNAKKPESGLDRDPLLLYFLRQSGARVPNRREEEELAAALADGAK